MNIFKYIAEIFTSNPDDSTDEVVISHKINSINDNTRSPDSFNGATNPSNGAPMNGSVDVYGNSYGSSSSSSHHHDYYR